jgi:hypothetical protein
LDELILYSFDRVSKSQATAKASTLIPFAPEYLQSIIDDFTPLFEKLKIEDAVKIFIKSLGLKARKEKEKEYHKNN